MSILEKLRNLGKKSPESSTEQLQITNDILPYSTETIKAQCRYFRKDLRQMSEKIDDYQASLDQINTQLKQNPNSPDANVLAKRAESIQDLINLLKNNKTTTKNQLLDLESRLGGSNR